MTVWGRQDVLHAIGSSKRSEAGRGRQQQKVVVTEDSGGLELTESPQYLDVVPTSIHEVANEPKPIHSGAERNGVEQSVERQGAALDVSHRVGGAVHHRVSALVFMLDRAIAPDAPTIPCSRRGSASRSRPVTNEDLRRS